MADAVEGAGGVAGKVAEKGGVKAVGKVAAKALPGLNVATAAYDTTKAVKAGKYGTAAVAAAEGIPGPAGWMAMGAQALGAGKVGDRVVKGAGKVASKGGFKKLAKVGAVAGPAGVMIAAGPLAHAMVKHHQQEQDKTSAKSTDKVKSTQPNVNHEIIDPQTGLPLSVSRARALEKDNPKAKLTNADRQKYQQAAEAYNKVADQHHERVANADLKGPAKANSAVHVTAQDMKSYEMAQKDGLLFNDRAKNSLTSPVNNSTVQDKTLTKDAKAQDNAAAKSEDKDQSHGFSLGKLAVGGGVAATGVAAAKHLMSGAQTGLNKSGRSLQSTFGKMTSSMQQGAKMNQATLQRDMAKAGAVSKGDAKQQANASEPSVG